VHYLHIGKTAGTQIGHVIKQVNLAQPGIRIINNGHGTMLRSLPSGSEYFFSLRDPIGRFRSGFYSRKRMGRPRLNNPWSPSETLIFEEFAHANDLAEALFRCDARGRKAMSAMLTIGHIGHSQVDWFKKAGDIFSLRPPVWDRHADHRSGKSPRERLFWHSAPVRTCEGKYSAPAFGRLPVLHPLRGVDGRTGRRGLPDWRRPPSVMTARHTKTRRHRRLLPPAPEVLQVLPPQKTTGSRLGAWE
jgi:hypothetical protein